MWTIYVHVSFHIESTARRTKNKPNSRELIPLTALSSLLITASPHARHVACCVLLPQPILQIFIQAVNLYARSKNSISVFYIWARLSLVICHREKMALYIVDKLHIVCQQTLLWTLGGRGGWNSFFGRLPPPLPSPKKSLLTQTLRRDPRAFCIIYVVGIYTYISDLLLPLKISIFWAELMSGPPFLKLAIKICIKISSFKISIFWAFRSFIKYR